VLKGSDHCPVYAVLKDTVSCDGKETDILDLMNPQGMVVNGSRRQAYDSKNLLPLSGKLIPEFDRRRSIKDMFRNSPLSAGSTNQVDLIGSDPPKTAASPPRPSPREDGGGRNQSSPTVPTREDGKRAGTGMPPPPKRLKQVGVRAKGQQTLSGFFVSAKPKAGHVDQNPSSSPQPNVGDEPGNNLPSPRPLSPDQSEQLSQEAFEEMAGSIANNKDSWARLFTKKPPPRCEGHDEPCISLVTKKPGLNCGRSFWICSRPLGPSGEKETGTAWRCPTFVWSSDWKAPGAQSSLQFDGNG
jgi:AP endonuclease-2